MGSQVFKRATEHDKTIPKWNGPFKVTKVLKKDVVEIDEKNRTSQQNIKNLRPFGEE